MLGSIEALIRALVKLNLASPLLHRKGVQAQLLYVRVLKYVGAQLISLAKLSSNKLLVRQALAAYEQLSLEPYFYACFLHNRQR